MQKITKLSILIPVYNEANTIHLILDRIAEVQLLSNIEKELILVNDCSTDNTEEALLSYIAAHPEANIRYYKHEVNKGKGAALHTAIPLATGEFTIIQDADLEYDPEEYNLLLKPVLRGDADIVYGSRFLGGNAHRILFFWHSIGNKFLTFLTNMLSNLNLTDVHTCYKLIENIVMLQSGYRLREKRFAFDPELTARVARIPGIRIYEVGTYLLLWPDLCGGQKDQLERRVRCPILHREIQHFQQEMNKHVQVQEDPETGRETLEIFAHTERFNRWMFGHLSRWCKGHVLEIGSGIGNLSALML